MITSTSNQKVKKIVQLNKKASERKTEDVFIAEGTKMFLEAPENMLQEVFISESFLSLQERQQEKQQERLQEKLDRCGYEIVSDEVFGKMSDTQTPQGILCVIKQLHYSLTDMIKAEQEPLFLVLENLQDPGNLGTIMRTGEGAGVNGIILSKDAVDMYNPKTIRSTMGSVYRMPFVYVNDVIETIDILKDNKITVYAAHLKGEAAYDRYDYKKGTAFLIGNEGNGLKEDTAQKADTYIKIPMKGQVESLNAAIAASLLVYEAARQRRA